jgi:hypothetical protein
MTRNGIHTERGAATAQPTMGRDARKCSCVGDHTDAYCDVHGAHADDAPETVEDVLAHMDSMAARKGQVKIREAHALNIGDFARRIRAALAERAQPTSAGAEASDKNAPCFLCGEMTCSVAGNPSRWPMDLEYRNGNGKRRHYCRGCVITAIHEKIEAARASAKEGEGRAMCDCGREITCVWCNSCRMCCECADEESDEEERAKQAAAAEGRSEAQGGENER